jgi:flagellar biogenesis protein FliO
MPPRALARRIGSPRIAGATARLALFAATLLLSTALYAADGGNALGLREDPVALPSMGRLIGAFLLVGALALAVAYLLKRFGTRFLPAAIAKGLHGNVSARVVIDRTTTLHVVDVEGERLAVVVGRQGIAVQALGAPRAREAAPVSVIAATTPRAE